MRRAPFPLLAVALAAACLCPAAASHGGGGALGYRSKVTGLAPPAPGLSVEVADYDDRLVVVNGTGRPLVILGYEGEPYLAFRDGKVFRNTRSPATYLNDDRFAEEPAPPEADADAAPEWEEVAAHERYEWHDHRIHWMSRVYPPKVAAAPDVPHHVFDWKVPGTLGAAPVAIEGTLDYEPPAGGGIPKLLLVPLGLLLAAAVAAAVLRRRRARRAP